MFASTSPSCSPSRLPSSDAFPCRSSSASILAHLCRLCHHDDRIPHRHRHHHHHRHPIVNHRVTWAPAVRCSRQHASVFLVGGQAYSTQAPPSCGICTQYYRASRVCVIAVGVSSMCVAAQEQVSGIYRACAHKSIRCLVARICLLLSVAYVLVEGAMTQQLSPWSVQRNIAR